MDIKTIDKSGELVRNKGQFKFIDPTDGQAYDPEYIYRADIEKGSWVHGQLQAGSFTRVDDDGEDLDIDGNPLIKKTPEKAPIKAPTPAPAPAAPKR